MVQDIRLITKREFNSFKKSWLCQDLQGNEPGLLQALADRLEEERNDVFGLFRNDTLVGVIGVTEENDLLEMGEVYTLIGILLVHPKHRHDGIGRRLVDFVKSTAKTNWIVASPVDEKARLFFLSCGFVHLETRNVENEYFLAFCLRPAGCMEDAALAKTEVGDLQSTGGFYVH